MYVFQQSCRRCCFLLKTEVLKQNNATFHISYHINATNNKLPANSNMIGNRRRNHANTHKCLKNSNNVNSKAYVCTASSKSTTPSSSSLSSRSRSSSTHSHSQSQTHSPQPSLLPPSSASWAKYSTRKSSSAPSSTSASEASFSTANRLLRLVDLTAGTDTGLFNKVFCAGFAFRTLFENIPEMEAEEKENFMEKFCRLRAYICGSDGFSKIEKEYLITEAMIWCPHISRIQYNRWHEQGMHSNPFEIQHICNLIAGEYCIEFLNAILLNSLFAASVDGLTEEEIEIFFKIANNLGIDAITSQELLEVYFLECELQQRYTKLIVKYS